MMAVRTTIILFTAHEANVAEQFSRDGYYLARQVFTGAVLEQLESDFDYIVRQLEDCGEDIPVKRLELDPAATRCVNCASG